MSSDNCVAILHTKEQFKATLFDEDGTPYGWENQFENKLDVWRVAHTQGIDNFDWFKENQIYMLGKYMTDVWGRSKIFYDFLEAKQFAVELADSIEPLEYGIMTIDGTEYDLSG